MAQSHNPGQGERLLSIGQRNIVSVLDSRRQKEADIRDAVYIRPKGNGRHVVKNFCNEQQYDVGTALGSLTFTPGQTVLLASHTGHPGEVIIGLPPIGKRGASAAPIVRHSRSRGTVPVTCPLVLSNRSYLGIGYEKVAGTGTLYAYSYTDGTYNSTINTKTVNSANLAAPSQYGTFRKAMGSSDQVVFVGLTNPGDRPSIVTWDTGANTIAINETVHDSFDIAGFLVVDSTVYTYTTFSGGGSGMFCYPMTCAVGASGVDSAGFNHTMGTQSGGDPNPGWPWNWRAADIDGDTSPGASLGTKLLVSGGSVIVPGFPDSAEGGLYLWNPMVENLYRTPFRYWSTGTTPGNYETSGFPFGANALFVADIVGGTEILMQGTGSFMGEVQWWPTAWTADNGFGDPLPCANGTEVSMTILGAEDWLVRLPYINYTSLDAEACTLPHHVIEPPDSGPPPQILFPLD